METFTSDDVLRLARLARLELTPEEVDLFTRQLSEILAFARQVNAVDTSAVDDAGTVAFASDPGVLRDDIVVPSLDRADVLELAPDADRAAGLFKVPRVFKG